MVIYIDKTVDQVLSSRGITHEESLLFQELAFACQRGYYYLCGDPDSLTRLSEIEELPLRKIYREIIGHYAEHGAVLGAVETLLVLTFQDTSPVEMLPALLKDKTCLSLPIPVCIAEKWKLLSECCLLGENLDDVELYHLMGQNYYIQKGFRGIQLNFHHESGGGDTTHHVLWKQVYQEKWPTLCIADSDQKYPSDGENPAPIGNTLKHLNEMKDYLEENCVLPFQLFPLYVHEAENLLPLSVVREVAEKNLPQMIPGLNLLERMKTIQNGVPLLYYDFKKGFPKIKDEKQHAYWETVRADLYAGEWDTTPLPQLGREKRDKTVFLGLGKQSPLRRACVIIARTLTQEKTSLELDDYLKPQWEKIGVTVFSWGCANQPLLG